MIDPHNKDTVDALRGKWIIEISEMECAKREINALKRFITCVSDRMRPAYARTTQDFPRQCIFIGTINPENGRGYLKDPTGNRRYWPLRVEAVDFVRLREDMDQIWAEALQVYKSGKCKLYLDTKELQDFAHNEAEERFETDPLQEIIENYVLEKEIDVITTVQITQDILMMPISKLDKFFSMRISCAMNRIGFENATKRIDGKVQRCYAKTRNENELEFSENENQTTLNQHENYTSLDTGNELSDTRIPTMDI